MKLYHDSSKRAIERPEEESHETKEDNAFERDSMQSENIGRDINAQPQLAQDDSPSLGDKNIPRATQIINLTAVDDILSQVSQQQIVSQDLTQIVDLTTDDEPHSQLSQKPIVSQDSAKGHQSLGERLDITPNRRRRSGGQKRVRDERDSEDDDIAGTTSSTRPAKRPRAASTDSHRVIPKGPDGLPAFEPSALGHNVKESTTSLVPVTDLKTSNQRQLAREIAVPEPVASTEQSHSPLMSKGSKKRSHLESFGSQSGLSEEASAAHKRPKPNVKQNRPDEDRSQAGVVSRSPQKTRDDHLAHNIKATEDAGEANMTTKPPRRWMTRATRILQQQQRLLLLGSKRNNYSK